MTGIVDRLEVRGLVERTAAERDRRVKLIALTDRGRKPREQLNRRMAESPGPIRRLSREDQETLRDIPSRALAEGGSASCGGRVRNMLDLGPPTSYLMLEKGADVYASDETKLGRVEEVRAEAGSDIFDGIVVRNRPLGGRHFYLEAEHVEEIFERGVLLRIDAAAAASLPDAG